MTNDKIGVLGRIKVAQKLALTSSCFVLAIAAIIYFAVESIQNQKDNALQVDMLGRERIMMHRYILQLQDVRAGKDIDHDYTYSLLSTTLRALDMGETLTRKHDGGQVVSDEIPAIDIPEARPKLKLIRELSEKMRVQGQTYLSVPKDDPARATRIMEDMKQDMEKMYAESNLILRMLRSDSRFEVNEMRKWIIIVGAIAAIIAIAISLYIGRAISKPLVATAEFAQRIARGELDMAPLIVRSDDEIGKLSASFNAMLTSIREMNGEIKTATIALNSASTEILATVQQQMSSADEQAAAVQQITATVEEINQSSGQVSERAQEVAVAGQSIAAAGAEGLAAARETSKAMESIREQAETVARNVVALSQSTQAISDIIATVTDIAEQSNLVALNAGIEAADAREEGRRFSVVANEMKNLADQAKAATSQVKSILEEIQKGINTSVMLTEEAVKRVETGRERTEVAQRSIRDMSDSISGNTIVFEQIVGATSQQRIGIEQVTKVLHGIREGSQQTVAGTQQLAESARNLNALSQQLQQTVERFQV